MKNSEIRIQKEKAEAFRKLHLTGKPFLLPNAWDAMSARLFAARDFPAVATTSGGVAWSLGYSDGEQAPWEEILGALQRMIRGLDCPLTVDLEAGYGASPELVAKSVGEVMAAGAVGINLEDGIHQPGKLRDLEESVAALRAARAAGEEAGVPIVINARVDTYLSGYGEDEKARFDETVRRAKAYLAAGADCIYPITLSNATVLGELAKAIQCPINVNASPALPSMAELERLGVVRVSTATGLTMIAYGAALDAALQVQGSGQFDCLKLNLDRVELQKLGALD